MSESIHARRTTAPALTLDANTLIPVGNDEIGEVATLAELATAIGGKVGVKVYRALLTQSGTDAPVATVLENSLGGTVVWTRDSSALYIGTLASAFPAAKTFPLPVVGVDGGGSLLVSRASNNSVQVTTTEGDDILNNTPIEILVYP